jgi:hypothetical protein
VLVAALCGARVEAAGERDPYSGALDLNVRPGNAEVFVDGVYYGTAGAFDGFPRYLWLEPGEHRLVFHLPGYRTIAREFTVASGQVVRVRTRLEKGETVPPETLFEKPTVRAEARRQADRERRAMWSEAPPEQEAPGLESPTTGIDLRSDPPRLLLDVRPEDAAVYLDGRFLGTGRELARLHSGLLIDAGSHVLEIVRPGFESRSVEFDALSGEDERLVVELEESGG